ncbi:hypothetical protein B0T26DRAFT_750482 [Lasiosphaeria miniovina]|uniref:Uncharacterized protein n=1 Tax=Lasiosphaeria miniovina TaxID=1954250 RepID=A0AA40AWD4_9PEZI|nr:uncharacterized protein B0T26DRAFT_750482 [Lasiosphaeria miniovina]KAK0723179.1 hypothetical protein B0T26DRAFT_750482 [Lasiosphaeria miniovina]
MSPVLPAPAVSMMKARRVDSQASAVEKGLPRGIDTVAPAISVRGDMTIAGLDSSRHARFNMSPVPTIMNM